MPRFAILTHDFPELHWDLLLEQESSLRTWRLQAPANSGGVIVAVPLDDHRKIYLDYEGPVSGNRGEVTRWDGGEMEWVLDSPTCVRARLSGKIVNGEIWLQATGDSKQWKFTCAPAPVSPP